MDQTCMKCAEHKISDAFHNELNPRSNSIVIGPERLKNAVLNLIGVIET